MSSYVAVTGSDELARAIIADNVNAVAFVELAAGVHTVCDYCDRDATRRIELGYHDGTRGAALVCTSHARHAAICIVGTL